MKNKSVLKLTIIASIALISSCTIQKRTFRSGYHIEWNKKYETTKANEETTESELAVSDEENTTVETTTATIDEKNLTTITTPQTDVLTETTYDIKTDEPFADPSNGFNSQNQAENNSCSKIESKKREKSNKLSSPPTNGGKLQIVALILCILLGLIGVHRFYLGYKGLGILYLFTLGLFGIGWLIDLILLIIPNGLTPKGRSNYKE